jgi:hypothetical protein
VTAAVRGLVQPYHLLLFSLHGVCNELGSLDGLVWQAGAINFSTKLNHHVIALVSATSEYCVDSHCPLRHSYIDL